MALDDDDVTFDDEVEPPVSPWRGEGAATRSNYVFYGYSGSQKEPVPKWPDGTDHDRSYEIAAKTIAESLKTLHPDDDTKVVQAWKKDIVLETIEAAKLPIREVHLCCHGDATRLSLAYGYNGSAWIEHSAKLMDGLSKRRLFGEKVFDDVGLGKASIASELAMCAGLFSSAMPWWRRAILRGKHGTGASWMIWGCYAGAASATHGSGYAAGHRWKSYFERMNLGAASVDGIAKEIARELDVTCTAATGHGGTQFWHAEKKKGKARTIVKNDASVAAAAPFWMWGVAKSRWVTYDETGKLLADPILFGKARASADLDTKDDAPPAWLTDLFYGKVH